jgi:hypothetical protein
MRSPIMYALAALVALVPHAVEAKKKKKDDTPDDKLSCKQLSGRIQVTVMQLRGFGGRDQASGFSRGIQSGFAATLGNQSHGTDPTGEYAAQMKALHAYNQRLVDKGCKSYDIEAELRKKDTDGMPAPTVAARKKSE